MKSAFFAPFFAAAVMLAVSCASAPKDAAPKDAASEETAPEASVTAGLPEGSGPGADESGTAGAETPLAAETPLSADTIPSAESPSPEVSDLPPQPMRGDKLITFYPEPDLLVPDASDVTDAAEVPPQEAAKAPEVKTPAAKNPAPKTVEPKASEPKDSGVKATAPKASAEKAPEVPAEPEQTVPEQGIWTVEPTAPTAVQGTEKKKTPSRSVSLAAGQNLQVWYPGTGWVYLGDASALNGLGYENRKLDRKDTLFSFKALRPGTFTLEFSRYDVLTDSFSEDLLQVTVTENTGKKAETVRAPDYHSAESSSEPTAAFLPATTASSSTGNPSGTLSGTLGDEPALVAGGPVQGASGKGAPSEGPDADTLLSSAKASLAKGDAAAALSSLDSFFAKAVTRLDEGWYLRGQAYEANGPARNVRMALDAYRTLKNAFPDSTLWKDADARVRYIERYFLNQR